MKSKWSIFFSAIILFSMVFSPLVQAMGSHHDDHSAPSSGSEIGFLAYWHSDPTNPEARAESARVVAELEKRTGLPGYFVSHMPIATWWDGISYLEGKGVKKFIILYMDDQPTYGSTLTDVLQWMADLPGGREPDGPNPWGKVKENQHYGQTVDYMGQTHIKFNQFSKSTFIITPTPTDPGDFALTVFENQIKAAMAKLGNPDPSSLSVMLVDHGAGSDEVNHRWVDYRQTQADALTQKLGLKRAGAFTIREDWGHLWPTSVNDMVYTANKWAENSTVIHVPIRENGLANGRDSATIIQQFNTANWTYAPAIMDLEQNKEELLNWATHMLKNTEAWIKAENPTHNSYFGRDEHGVEGGIQPGGDHHATQRDEHQHHMLRSETLEMRITEGKNHVDNPDNYDRETDGSSVPDDTPTPIENHVNDQDVTENETSDLGSVDASAPAEDHFGNPDTTDHRTSSKEETVKVAEMDHGSHGGGHDHGDHDMPAPPPTRPASPTLSSRPVSDIGFLAYWHSSPSDPGVRGQSARLVADLENATGMPGYFVSHMPLAPWWDGIAYLEAKGVKRFIILYMDDQPTYGSTLTDVVQWMTDLPGARTPGKHEKGWGVVIPNEKYGPIVNYMGETHIKFNTFSNATFIMTPTSADSDEYSLTVFERQIREAMKQIPNKDLSEVSVMFIDHGASDNGVNKSWNDFRQAQAEKIMKKLGLKRAGAFTIREDWPNLWPVSVDNMIEKANEWAQDSTVIHVPVRATGRAAGASSAEIVEKFDEAHWIYAPAIMEVEGNYEELSKWATNTLNAAKRWTDVVQPTKNTFYGRTSAGVKGGIPSSSPQADQATITDLQVKNGSWPTPFHPWVPDQMVHLNQGQKVAEITAELEDPHAVMKINGEIVKNNEAKKVNLTQTHNHFTIEVTAADQETKMKYLLHIHRTSSSSSSSGSSSSPGPSNPTNQDTQEAKSATSTIDSSKNAIVESKTGSLKLDIPAGSISSDPNAKIDVSIQEIEQQDLEQRISKSFVPTGFKSLGKAFEFKAQAADEKDSKLITSFAKPITFSLKLEKEDLQGVDPNKVGLFRLNVDHTLTFIGGRIIDDHLVVEMNGFSTYVLGEVNLSFPDLDNHWAKKDIEWMASKFAVQGFPSGEFGPNKQVTRAQFITMLMQMVKLPQSNQSLPFSDVKIGDWYTGSLATAMGAGVIKGMHDGTFRPNDPITREQMAVMVSKALKVKKQASQEVVSTSDSLVVYQDQDQVSSWAKQDMAFVVRQGIMRGNTNKELAPRAVGTRAEATVLMARIWGQ